MGKCWNCNKDVFLKEKETRCDNCKVTVRYWCHSCAQPFDVEDKKTNKKIQECKWCGYFLCPNCDACSPDCSKFQHHKQVKEFLNGFIQIDKWKAIDKAIENIITYFEEVKLGKDQTNCAFGVPKTYAKNRIKAILARMKGFRIKDYADQDAFTKRYEEVLYKELGSELTIKNVREAGSYGQEYRDVFNLCVCLGKLEYKKKPIIKEGKKIGEYDSWTRVENDKCSYLDMESLIVRYCKKCKGVFPQTEKYCNKCVYTKGGKLHPKDSKFVLIEKLSNNPTCKNLGSFKKRGESDGQS